MTFVVVQETVMGSFGSMTGGLFTPLINRSTVGGAVTLKVAVVQLLLSFDSGTLLLISAHISY